ncbi:MAG TPA: GIY-YIG nuclease family protein [Burkholderiales bacterium]|nr:GIY-YIG nuclease family protein [Burkholderiales bacterium]
MDKQYLSLDDILDDSDFGEVFSIKPTNPVISADDRLIESFNEINKFIDQHGHEPTNMLDMNERKLAKRLENFRDEPEKSITLKPHDKHNLLQIQEKPIESLDDILQDDFLASILGDDSSALGIFDLKHVKHSSERQATDFVARRKVCKNFAKYEPLFKQCQTELKSGARKLIKFNEQSLAPNTYFIINGVLGYLETVYDLVKDKNSKFDGRIYCVFENGTESNMLFRSLGKMLYDNGQIVSSSNAENIAEFHHGFNLISEDDQSTGYIYILKSKSTNPKVANIDNLYKIGYSTIPVEERIKNAENEATYLMAPVEIVSIYECYNLNPQKFEHIMHTFFASACLNLDVFGEESKRYNPREWFILPLSVIEQAIGLIISGDIINYNFNSKLSLIQTNI